MCLNTNKYYRHCYFCPKQFVNAMLMQVHVIIAILKIIFQKQVPYLCVRLLIYTYLEYICLMWWFCNGTIRSSREQRERWPGMQINPTAGAAPLAERTVCGGGPGTPEGSLSRRRRLICAPSYGAMSC